jgi:hypothetical protein
MSDRIRELWDKFLGWIVRRREWLTNNEIFFKTLFLLVLTITGIYISYQSYQNSVYQTKISESQLLPIFRFNVGLIYNTDQSFYTNDFLEIYNDGHPINNLEYENVNFFEERIQNMTTFSTSVIDLPIESYYLVDVRTSNTTGLLVTMYNPENIKGNNYETYLVTTSFSEYISNKTNQKMTGYVDLKRYVRLKYDDVLGDSHEDFYYVDEFGGHKLTDTEGNIIFKNYHDSLNNTQFVLGSSIEDLYNASMKLYLKENSQ